MGRIVLCVVVGRFVLIVLWGMLFRMGDVLVGVVLGIILCRLLLLLMGIVILNLYVLHAIQPYHNAQPAQSNPAHQPHPARYANPHTSPSAADAPNAKHPTTTNPQPKPASPAPQHAQPVQVQLNA